jgi:hypothetical protein
MTVHLTRCQECRQLSPLPQPWHRLWLRVALVSSPFILGGAVAALARPDFLVVSGFGAFVALVAHCVLREACPHCRSSRTTRLRIRYLTVVR